MGKKQKVKVDPNNKTIALNRKARFNYMVIETYEAGIVLQGTEVKSIRQGKVNMADTFAKFLKDELYVINMHISPYEQGNRFNHEPTRSRKLLMHKRELAKLHGKIKEKGLTLIPTKMYFKNGFVKVELGLCKGKKDFEKSESQKRRQEKVKLQRMIKERR